MDGWEQHRRYLFAVAYRLLGSAADAEDAVQEAYVGIRLPDPLVGYDDTDLGDTVALRESVRTAVLLVLETLSPAERVAFVLHDAFGMDFDRLAVVLDRTPAACRQLASRARRRVRAEAPPRKPVSAEENQRVLAAFVAASSDGGLAELVHLLDPQIVLRSDRRGTGPAARKPVHGPERVFTMMSRLIRRYAGVRLEQVSLASGDGFVLTVDDAVLGVVGVEIADGRAAELNVVVSPDAARFHQAWR